MFNPNGQQKGGERLDVGSLNGAINRINSQENIKPMYLNNAYLGFTNSIFQPVMTFKSGLLGLLFINKQEVATTFWDTITYPPTPNIDEVLLNTTLGVAVTTTIDKNLTGNISIPNANNTKTTIGSYRYIEISFTGTGNYHYLTRLKYDGGDAENGIFYELQMLSGGVNVKIECEVWSIGIQEYTVPYVLPISYNYPLSQDLATIMKERLDNKVIGFSTNGEKWTGYNVGSLTTPQTGVILDLSAFEDKWAKNYKSFINIGFLTGGKTTLSDVTWSTLKGGFIQRSVSITAHSSGKQFVFMTLEVKGSGNFDEQFLLINLDAGSISEVKGLFVAVGTYGSIYYQPTFAERDILGRLKNNTGTIAFLDAYSVNAILQAPDSLFFEDYGNSTIVDADTFKIKKLKKTNIDSISMLESTDADKIDTGRGCFIIS